MSLSDEQLAEFTSAVAVGILVQMQMALPDQDMMKDIVRLDDLPNRDIAITYLIGYTKAAHRILEDQTQQTVNDSNFMIAIVGSIFAHDDIKQIYGSLKQAMLYLDKDLPEFRATFLAGARDYEMPLQNERFSPAGLTRILLGDRA